MSDSSTTDNTPSLQRQPSRLRWLGLIGPGLLVAATGVGAGDLATGAITGSKLGVAVLWAVLIGAGLKFVLNEGLARWQLATGETLLEGACVRLGPVVQYGFLLYLVIWTYFTAGALMGATGVAGHAILPLVDSTTDKIIYGIAHSLVAVLLVRLGGYRLFEKIMGVCIALMFVTVIATTIASGPDWSAVARGLFVPSVPATENKNGIMLTFALMGGVGGTLTILCYGYWIREEGRSGAEAVKLCRIDIATGYLMTAIFGCAMVILGSQIQIADGKGAGLLVTLADKLQSQLGSAGLFARWAFLIGAWGAIASSMLGVWQSVPYLFADFWRIQRRDSTSLNDSSDVALTASPEYRWYLFALATIPAVGLWFSFQKMQIVYAVVGGFFMPLVAVVLLLLNGNAKYVGKQLKNSWMTNILLSTAILVFLIIAGMDLYGRFFAE